MEKTEVVVPMGWLMEIAEELKNTDPKKQFLAFWYCDYEGLKFKAVRTWVSPHIGPGIKITVEKTK